MGLAIVLTGSAHGAISLADITGMEVLALLVVASPRIVPWFAQTRATFCLRECLP